METKENKPDIYNVAVEQMRDFNINNAIVDVFEKNGGHCHLEYEKMSPKELSGLYFFMGRYNDILLIKKEDAISLDLVLMSPQSFFGAFVGMTSIETGDQIKEEREPENKGDNLPTPEEIFGNEEPKKTEMELVKAIRFPFAFFGVSDESGNKANIIARVFHKHGLSKNFTGNSFTDPDWIYAIETNKSIQMEGHWSKYVSKGYEVMTIDHYLDIHPEDKDCIPEPEGDDWDQKKINEERKGAFEDLSGEIMMFLHQPFCHPHMTIIADCNHVELLEGIQCENFITKEEK